MPINSGLGREEKSMLITNASEPLGEESGE